MLVWVRLRPILVMPISHALPTEIERFSPTMRRVRATATGSHLWQVNFLVSTVARCEDASTEPWAPQDIRGVRTTASLDEQTPKVRIMELTKQAARSTGNLYVSEGGTEVLHMCRGPAPALDGVAGFLWGINLDGPNWAAEAPLSFPPHPGSHEIE